MKHFILFIFFLLILSACVQNTKNQSDEVVASTTESDESVSSQSQYMLANIVDSIIAANPDYLSNDIKKKKVAKEIQSKVLAAVAADHNVLTEIPLSYEMMMQNGSKYIIKFELSNIGKSGTQISDKYDIYFNVFTEMTEDEASALVDKQKYHLSFESVSNVNGNLVLPSGRTFTDEPQVYKFSTDNKPNVCPGAFLLRGVSFSK